ncbi:MAG: hypothetical protein ACLFVQ_14445 [Chitinispirillaceae bacterium]
MKNFKRVFILGAGFSKSFSPGMPVISDLSDVLFNDDNNTDYAELRSFASRYYEASNHLQDTRDIENVATVILNKKIFKNDIERHRFQILRYQLLKLVHHQTKNHRLEPGCRDQLTRFVSFCRNSSSLLITFNYDLLVEACSDVSYGIVNKYQSQIHPTGTGTDYIKLHGSLNWFRAKGAQRTDINSVYRVDELDEHFSIHRFDIPVFIPMAHAKETFLDGTLFSTLWAQAIYHLEQASEIVLIGYSFPLTDIENLYFILNFIRKISRIVIYFENAADSRLERLKGIFGRERVINMDAKKFLYRSYLS